MKRLLGVLLISGYVALIPACFFGGDLVVSSVSASTHAKEIAGVAETTADCPTGDAACAGNSGTAPGLSHHLDMYSSFSGFAQTQGPLLLAILSLALLPVLLFAFTYRPLFSTIPAKVFSYIKNSKQIASLSKTAFREWLSLSINSPAYALVM